MTKISFQTVDESTIPETTERTAKYQEILDNAKELENNKAIKITEQENVSLSSLRTFMRKQGYKTTQRKVKNKTVLWIQKKPEEQPEETQDKDLQ